MPIQDKNEICSEDLQALVTGLTISGKTINISYVGGDDYVEENKLTTNLPIPEYFGRTDSSDTNTNIKKISIDGFVLKEGVVITLLITKDDTSSGNLSLSINSDTAIPLKYQGKVFPKEYWKQSNVYSFVYDVTSNGSWRFIGELDTDTKYSVMTGATSDTDGKSGLVPAPKSTNSTQYLRGDGTWSTPTNNKVTQTITTANAEYALLAMADASATATKTNGARFASAVTLNPSSGTITATKFKGALDGNASTATTASSCSGNAATATTASSCSGNAATATRATQDASGNVITSTYVPIISEGTYINQNVIELKIQNTTSTQKTYTLPKDFFGNIDISASNSSGTGSSGGTFNISIGDIVDVSVTCGWKDNGNDDYTYGENKTFPIYIPKTTIITCATDGTDKPYASNCYISLNGLLRK